MTNTTLGSALTTLDSGVALSVSISNLSASVDVFVFRGGVNIARLRPGQNQSFQPEGAPIAARTDSGTALIDVVRKVITVADPFIAGAAASTWARNTGSVTAFLGDSICGLGGGNQFQTSDAFPFYTCANSGGRLTYGGTWSYAGQTSAVILASLTLGPGLLTEAFKKPSRCVVLAGTNDVGSAVPLATSLANMQAIYSTLQANGIAPVACTIPPRGDSSSANAAVDKFNVGVRRLAMTLGLELIDFHSVLVDRVTGSFKTGLALNDNIHPSWLGSKKMGEYAAAQLSSGLRPAPLGVPSRVGDTSDLFVGKGLFTAAVQGDGTVNNYDYYNITGHTVSVTTDADGTKWQRLTMDSAATGNPQPLLRFAVNSGGAAAGDLLELVGRFRTSGFDAAVTANNASGASFSLSAEISAIPSNTYGSAVNSIHCDVADGFASIRVPAPVGSTGLVRLNLQGSKPASGTCWVEFNGVAIRNLTALGLASI